MPNQLKINFPDIENILGDRLEEVVRKDNGVEVTTNQSMVIGDLEQLKRQGLKLSSSEDLLYGKRRYILSYIK